MREKQNKQRNDDESPTWYESLNELGAALEVVEWETGAL
jgi:hypothetical protein